jgi:hypothetical protein
LNKVSRDHSKKSQKLKKTSKFKNKKIPKDNNIKNISKWGFDIETQEKSSKSRKIRLSKKEIKNNPLGKDNRKHFIKEKKYTKINRLTPPKEQTYLNKFKQKSSSKEIKRQPRNFIELKEHRSKDYDSFNTEDSDLYLQNDFFSKVEQISRNSESENPNFSSYNNSKQKKPYSRIVKPYKNDSYPINQNEINILVSFGETIQSSQKELRPFPPNKTIQRSKSKPKRAIFRKNKEVSYYSKASQKWNWTNSYSKKSNDTQSKFRSPYSIKNETRTNEKKISRSKSKTSLKGEQRRLRAALKSIKF